MYTLGQANPEAVHVEGCVLGAQVGKKKTQDVQFYTEVMEVNQAIDAGRRSMYDPDELEEEQRERETRNRVRPRILRACACLAPTEICCLRRANLQGVQQKGSCKHALHFCSCCTTLQAAKLIGHNEATIILVTSSQSTVSFLLYTPELLHQWPVALAAGQSARYHHGFCQSPPVAIWAR